MINFSLIIPIYNAEKYISKCLDSIFKDNFSPKIEVICINDGSTDQSLKILENYKKENNNLNLRIINQENGGASKARNVGIKLAQGYLIMFIDADDFIEPGILNDFLNEYLIYDCDLAFSGIKRISRRGEISICELNERFYSKQEFGKALLDIDELTFGSPCAKIFKKDIIIKNNIFFDEKLKLFEDAIFVYKYLTHCKTIATFKSVFYCYNVNQFSTTSKYYGITFWRSLSYYRNIKEKVQNEIKEIDFTLYENLIKKVTDQIHLKYYIICILSTEIRIVPRNLKTNIII